MNTVLYLATKTKTIQKPSALQYSSFSFVTWVSEDGGNERRRFKGVWLLGRSGPLLIGGDLQGKTEGRGTKTSRHMQASKKKGIT